MAGSKHPLKSFQNGVYGGRKVFSMQRGFQLHEKRRGCFNSRNGRLGRKRKPKNEDLESWGQCANSKKNPKTTHYSLEHRILKMGEKKRLKTKGHFGQFFSTKGGVQPGGRWEATLKEATKGKGVFVVQGGHESHP